MVVIDIAFSDESIVDNKQSRGIKDTNLFNSALNEPKQTFDKKDLYADIITKAACYLRSFSMNHPFYDGNKRTALMATVIFLERNGYEVIADNDKLYKFVEKVVRGKLQISSIARRLKKFIKPVPTRKRKLSPIEFIEDIINKARNK